MKPNSNKVIDVKNYIKKELSTSYTLNEISSLTNILLEEYADLKPAHHLAFPEETINESPLINIMVAVYKLKKHTPIQYILGYKEFLDLKILVNSSVLIPRPETEELVQVLISENNNLNLHILDLCTGSGCIALALNKHLEKSCVTAVDISKQALNVANENNKQLGLDVEFQELDILKPFPIPEQYDIIVSNPPYVMQSEQQEMQDNVLLYEPSLALFVSDSNPLIFYKSIVQIALTNLKHNGKLYLEINPKLCRQTLSLLSCSKFKAEIKKDIFNKERFIIATKI